MKKYLAIIAAMSFFLNFTWENLQAPLYQGYGGFWNHVSICSLASLGDAVAIVIGYLLVRLVTKRIAWFKYFRLSEQVLFLLFTLSLAYVVEWVALSQKLWAYTPSMPLVLNTHIGLLPFIQLAVTGALSLYIAHWATSDSLTPYHT